MAQPATSGNDGCDTLAHASFVPEEVSPYFGPTSFCNASAGEVVDIES